MQEAAGTILIVDDEEIVRNVAGAILRSQGYEVLRAENSAAAIALMREYADEISLMLLDADAMPLPSGNLAAALSSMNPKVAIVVSSGAPPEEALLYFCEGQVAGFLQKPYTASRLREAVSHALRMRPVSGLRD